MMTTEHKLEEIKRKMKRQLEKGQNCEKTNDIYRELIAKLEQKKHLIELMNMKDSKYYENQFKPKSYEK
jgi:hypothetical protein